MGDVTVMKVVCLFCAVMTVAAITDEQYYSMPRLFELDDYDECLGSHGAFCVGSFHLTSQKYSRLLDLIQQYSEEKYKFNRTVINRGYCITTTCSHISGETLPHVFEECVHNITKTKYKLDAKLLNLEYCKTSSSPPTIPFDNYDLIFVCVTGLIIIANVIGTAYDILRSRSNKCSPNRYLMSWSLISNWQRLTAYQDKGDPRLDALNPVHGLKSITLILVVLTHSIIVHHLTYIHNPRFFEIGNVHPLSTILHNGTAVVQTFIILSTFLLTYNVLLSLEKDPEKKLDFCFWLKMITHRIIRIAPLNIFMIGLSATWWRFFSDGPLWTPLVEDEVARCRRKFWTHLLFINNLVSPDDRCLIQSWFLAVDMQLYVISSIVLVFLLRRPRTAMKVLAGLFVLTIVVDYLLIYFLDLKSILFISAPEHIRSEYIGEPSFKWQYAAAWSSAPASVLGLLLAFLYHGMRKADYQLHENKVFRILYRLSVPAILLWIMSGYPIRDSTSGDLIALYTALDRPIYNIIVSITMIGLFYKIDRIYWSVLSWRAWQILGRMSLSVLLVHWCYNLTFVAIKTNASRGSVFEVGGHNFAALFMTYVTSLPLYLMVEVPVQKFLQALSNIR